MKVLYNSEEFGWLEEQKPESFADRLIPVRFFNILLSMPHWPNINSFTFSTFVSVKMQTVKQVNTAMMSEFNCVKTKRRRDMLATAAGSRCLWKFSTAIRAMFSGWRAGALTMGGEDTEKVLLIFYLKVPHIFKRSPFHSTNSLSIGMDRNANDLNFLRRCVWREFMHQS